MSKSTCQPTIQSVSLYRLAAGCRIESDSAPDNEDVSLLFHARKSSLNFSQHIDTWTTATQKQTLLAYAHISHIPLWHLNFMWDQSYTISRFAFLLRNLQDHASLLSSSAHVLLLKQRRRESQSRLSVGRGKYLPQNGVEERGYVEWGWLVSSLRPDLPLRWCKSGGNLFSLRTLNSQSLSMASQLLEIPSL